MKITAIRLQRLRLELDPPFNAAWDPEPRRSFAATVVRVETDEGLVGVGSGDTMDGFEAYEHLFLGEDPLAINRHVRSLETIAFHAARYWPLEAALWDLAGQACGQPVATLLGGATDRLVAYASWGEVRTPEQRAEDAARLREDGFRAVKVRIRRDGLDEGMATVAAIRQSVGDGLDVLVDLNQAWRMPGDIGPGLEPGAARRLVAALGELGVVWVEEPLAGTDVEGLAALRHATGVRIAGGEMARTVPELLGYLEADALDVYQPDAVLAVGLSRARLVAELALVRNRWFTPHSWTNGIGLLANLQLAAGVGAGPYFEVPHDPPTWTPERRDFMLAEPLKVGRDGTVAVPDAPGLGVVLDEDAIARYAV